MENTMIGCLEQKAFPLKEQRKMTCFLKWGVL